MKNYDIITKLEKEGISYKTPSYKEINFLNKRMQEFCAILNYYIALYEFRKTKEIPYDYRLDGDYELYKNQLCVAIRNLVKLKVYFPEKNFSKYMENDRVDFIKWINRIFTTNTDDYYAYSYDLLFFVITKTKDYNIKEDLNYFVKTIERASEVYRSIKMRDDEFVEMFDEGDIVNVLSVGMRSSLLSFFEYDLIPFLKRSKDDGRFDSKDYNLINSIIVDQLFSFYLNRRYNMYNVNDFSFKEALNSLVANRVVLDEQINRYLRELVDSRVISIEDKASLIKDYFKQTQDFVNRPRGDEEAMALLAADNRTRLTIIDEMKNGYAELNDKGMDSVLDSIISPEDCRFIFYYLLSSLDKLNFDIINKKDNYWDFTPEILLKVISNKNLKIDFSMEKEILSLVDLGAFTIDEMSLALARRNDNGEIVQDILNKLRLRADSTLYRDIPEDVFTYKI